MTKFNLPAWLRIGVASLTLLLTACPGGGGGGGGAPPPTEPVTSTLSFPLQSAFVTMVANGYTFSLHANGDGSVPSNGDCTGTFNVTEAPANTAATFEGDPAALSATGVVTLAFTNCVPSPIIGNTTSYYNSVYLPLGFQVAGGDYGVYAPPPVYPSSVKVGDSANIGTIQLYVDSTKAVPNGREEVSFVVLPATATAAIIMLTTKEYDAASVLQFTEQDQYWITSNGALTLVAVDLQQVNPPLHLFFK